MRVIVLTGGGTSGHVTPNIALIPKLKNLGYKVHYIGSKSGIEKQLVEKEGKLRRYMDLKNFTDIFRVIDGFRQSLAIIGELKPDIIFSKGGFVSCPVVWAAWVKKIPIIIHESDMTPGLTNKLSMPFASKVCYTFPESKQHISNQKGILTGVPIREEILRGDKKKGRKICNFDDKKPVLMVIGGSQGSENINKAIRSSKEMLLKDFQICHICGKGNIKRDLEGIKGYKQFEYVNEEQPHIFALADLVVSRAGATTLFEILALRKPNLLIPLSRNASRGDQILNAQSFEKQGFSKVLEEEDLTLERLMSDIKMLYKNRYEYINAMEKSKVRTAADHIVSIIKDCNES